MSCTLYGDFLRRRFSFSAGEEILFFFSFIIYLFFKILFYLPLQYCIGFAIYQNESATGIHVFPILNLLLPPSPYHLSGSSQCTSPKHSVSCIEPGLATRFIYDIIHISMPFSQIIPPCPYSHTQCWNLLSRWYSVLHTVALVSGSAVLPGVRLLAKRLLLPPLQPSLQKPRTAFLGGE